MGRLRGPRWQSATAAGALALHLARASGITGEVIEVDAGLHLLAARV